MPDIDTLESVGGSSTDPDSEFTLSSSGPPPSQNGTNGTSNTCQEIEIRFEFSYLHLIRLNRALANVQAKTKMEKRRVIRAAIAFMAQHRVVDLARWRDWSERVNRDGNGNDLDDRLLPEITVALDNYLAEDLNSLEIEG